MTTFYDTCRSLDIWTANKICGDSYQCKYDYAVSLNEDLAKNTLKFQDAFVNIKTRNKERGKRVVKYFPSAFDMVASAFA